MRRPRFTTRTAIVIVALASLAAWGVAMQRRSDAYTARAREHELRRWSYSINVSVWSAEKAQHPGSRDYYEALLAPLQRGAEYEDRLVRKYRRAARYPWLPVAPDPPAPPDIPAPP
jgi:hypothetical protein